MERIREAVIGFYENRRREFFMVVVLVLLVIENTFSYFAGSPNNMFAMMFGKRGAKKTAVTQQQNQPQVATETVKENQKLQEAATNAGTGTPQQNQSAPVKTEETQTAAPHALTAPATPAAQEKTTTEVSPQKNEETKTQTQAGKPAPEEQKTSQAYVFAKTGYQILDKTFFYRDDPFNPIVKAEPVDGGHGGGWTPPPHNRGACAVHWYWEAVFIRLQVLSGPRKKRFLQVLKAGYRPFPVWKAGKFKL